MRSTGSLSGRTTFSPALQGKSAVPRHTPWRAGAAVMSQTSMRAGSSLTGPLADVVVAEEMPRFESLPHATSFNDLVLRLRSH